MIVQSAPSIPITIALLGSGEEQVMEKPAIASTPMKLTEVSAFRGKRLVMKVLSSWDEKRRFFTSRTIPRSDIVSTLIELAEVPTLPQPFVTQGSRSREPVSFEIPEKNNPAKSVEIRLLGQRFHPLTMADLNSIIAEMIDGGGRSIIGHHNLHSIFLTQRDPLVNRFFEKADIVHFDSMPLVALGKVLGHPLGRAHRVTYVDWLQPLMALSAERGWRVFYLGGRPGVAAKAARILEKKHPGLSLETHHGYFDASCGSAENREVLEVVRQSGTQLLLVGMGMPRQENWVLENLEGISANAILTAGACFDYVAGAIPVPPRWSGRLGLEWLFRLASEPRRLARRYLVEPWFVLPLVAREVRSR
jgi:N-acetylglucosaminyldiphosphoundecaprenol N-acetyl-beta-D-mannosaminyltransferase